MIRFIDIRGQGTGCRFAFWDTVTDSFVNLDGDFAWNTWEELFDSGGNAADIDRYHSLCPSWVFDGGEDDIYAFYNEEDVIDKETFSRPTHSEFVAYVKEWIKNNPEKIKSHIEAIECLSFTPSKTE